MTDSDDAASQSEIYERLRHAAETLPPEQVTNLERLLRAAGKHPEGEEKADVTEREVLDEQLLKAAVDLNPEQMKNFERLLRATGKSSHLGSLVRRAETERKLVLFTLGIVVLVLIICVVLLEAFDDKNSGELTTSLIGLAGTGLGFIGGMVAADFGRSGGKDRS